LKALNILRPEGNAPAEVRAVVDDLSRAFASRAAADDDGVVVVRDKPRSGRSLKLPFTAVAAAMVAVLTVLLANGAAACRDPSHGVEGYAHNVQVERISDPLPVDTPPSHWCEAAIQRVKVEQTVQVSVVESGRVEDANCAPGALMPCAQARFRCVLSVASEPQYARRTTLACLR
jgi:hypothetical protein